MTSQPEISDIAKETLYTLNYFEPNFISKIPEKVINGIKELAQTSSIIVKIDKSKKLKEQNISEGCKDFISLIYYDYIATEEEKKELIKIWNKNEQLYQEKLREKYNSDNIFKRNKINDSEKEVSNLPTVIQKENIIQKIIKSLKKLFKH